MTTMIGLVGFRSSGIEDLLSKIPGTVRCNTSSDVQKVYASGGKVVRIMKASHGHIPEDDSNILDIETQFCIPVVYNDAAMSEVLRRIKLVTNIE